MTDIYMDAVSKLKHFIESDLSQYAKDRNYDYGIDKRNNVSMLSKFISHRIISEYYIVEKVLEKYKLTKSEKYIQEIFWRVYWKGWLEHRPGVWNDYVDFNSSSINKKDLEQAYKGATNIDCFNDWVNELKTTNYLHNHTRMWFASIWIFTLGLPWQLGANFFMHHLYDGDPASNTLSWRWVAGIQTIGKNYLATSSNIAKYTAGKYRPNNIIEDAEPLTSSKIYNVNELDFSNFRSNNDNLMVFDSNLDYQFINHCKDRYKKIYFVLLLNDHRKITLSERVISFKKALIDDISSKFDQSIILNGDDCITLLDGDETFDIIYPSIGENLSFINSYKKSEKTNFVYNERDLECWKFSKKGFFNFKKNIPGIIKNLNSNGELFT